MTCLIDGRRCENRWGPKLKQEYGHRPLKIIRDVAVQDPKSQWNGLAKSIFDTGHSQSPPRNRGSTNADTGPAQKDSCPETQTLHENMPGMRSKKRCDSREMQKVPQQEPPLEEERNRKVIMSFLYQRVLYKLSMLKAVFAQPFFIKGTVWPHMCMAFNTSPPVLTSSPQATPTTPS